MSQSTEPFVPSEKGYDQTDVPNERANTTPDAEPKLERCDPERGLHSDPHKGCILR